MAARASLLILHARPAPRQVCISRGGDILVRGDGVSTISEILQGLFAPKAFDAIRQQVMRFLRIRRADHSVGEFFAEFDLIRREAGPKVGMGAGYPDQIASILRMDNAALSRQEKSLLMAICHTSLWFADASANMRRLFVSRGIERRQDAMISRKAVEPRVSDEDLEAPAAYGGAKCGGRGRRRKRVPQKRVGTR